MMTANNPELHRTIYQRIKDANRILVISHIRPDGDAIGSLIGLGMALLDAGKETQMVLSDGLPASFRFLSGSEWVKKQPEGDFDLIISLDISDPPRAGYTLNDKTVNINIDHHITNLEFGEINFVDPEAVATAEIVAEHLQDWGLNSNEQIASALLCGIVTDTIGFRTSNMNPKALRIAANLMEAGANLPQIYQAALTTRAFEATRYWGLALCKMQREDRLIWTELTLEDRATAGYNGNDDADLNNLLSTISDCDITVLFVEQKGERVKISWRSQPGWDVSKLASLFGGGGHPAAAGAEINGNFTEVKAQVLLTTKEFLINRTLQLN